VNYNEPEEFFRTGLRIVTIKDEPIDIELVMFSRKFEFAYYMTEVFGGREYGSGVVDITGEIATIGVEYCLTGVCVIEHFAETFP